MKKAVASAAKQTTSLQFGRRVPVSTDGTHVRPEPVSFGLDNPLQFSGESEAELLPQVFTVATALLKQGRTDYALAVTDRLQIVIKCYATGGENYLHAHTQEDHSFIVLQGQATFYGSKGKVATVGRNQGVLIPRGSYYSFESSAPEPLVLLRAGVPWPGSKVIAEDGHPRQVDKRDMAFPDAVPLPGAFYR